MRHSILMLSLATALAAAGCARDAAPTTDAAAPAAATAATAEPAAQSDEHSYSEPAKVKTTDLALDLAIDFAKKQLSGTATYTLEWLDQAATQLVLDTRDLTISTIEGQGADGQWTPLQYALAPADKILGSKLTIETPTRPTQVRVAYTTSPQASGLQWLEPSMTAGKQGPFMFSQSQQIHARSWVPLQDTTQVRFTYSAHVTAPKDAMVLMSADNDPKAARDGDYTFKMPQKIPSYLMAIAAGDLVFEPITAQAGVWAEPSMAKKAAAEFADTGKMIDTTEKLYGPYRWDRYDILVLPPSFPYGGMENPRLTFATPTVITGDKSLVALVAHELAHSWSGNLVTFSSAKDAWLNEGLTSYVENRIIEDLYGKERADMENVIERNELRKEFTDANKALQPLAVKAGVLKDPDENLSSTVYTKGAWFMQFLEQRIGRADFDAFLRGYFDHFAFQSISTQQFADYAKANLLDKYPGQGHPGRIRRVAVCAGRAGDRAADRVARASMRSTPRARPGWRPAQTAGRGADRKVDHAGVGALHRGHAGNARRPRTWPRSMPRTTSPARRTARSRNAGIRWRCAAATPKRSRTWPRSCSALAGAS